MADGLVIDNFAGGGGASTVVKGLDVQCLPVGVFAADTLRGKVARLIEGGGFDDDRAAFLEAVESWDDGDFVAHSAIPFMLVKCAAEALRKYLCGGSRRIARTGTFFFGGLAA